MGKRNLRTRYLRAALPAVLLALALLSASCGSDKTSMIVWDRSPRGDTGGGPFTPSPLHPSADTYFIFRVPTYGATVLLEGHLPDGYDARPYILFGNLPDTVTVVPDSILSATFTVIARDRYGPDPTTLSLYAAPAAWSPDSILTYEEDPGGTLIGDLAPAQVTAIDSTHLASPVPVATIISWLRDPSTNFGFYLDSPASNDALLRLFSLEANSGLQAPSLTIRYTWSGVLDSVVVHATQDASALRLPAVPPAAGDETTLSIADGQALRSIIQFDPDSLRARVPSGATVNHAGLVLTVVDTSRILTSISLAAYAATSAWTEPDADSTVTTSATAAATTTYEAGASTIEFEIAGLVQEWLDGDLENDGVVVRSIVEPYDVATIAVGSREAVPALRPRLDLVYTTPPGPRP